MYELSYQSVQHVNLLTKIIKEESKI